MADMLSPLLICMTQKSHQLTNTKLEVARQEGLEPPTYCLEGSCSIRMSYWRVWSE